MADADKTGSEQIAENVFQAVAGYIESRITAAVSAAVSEQLELLAGLERRLSTLEERAAKGRR